MPWGNRPAAPRRSGSCAGNRTGDRRFRWLVSTWTRPVYNLRWKKETGCEEVRTHRPGAGRQGGGPPAAVALVSFRGPARRREPACAHRAGIFPGVRFRLPQGHERLSLSDAGRAGGRPDTVRPRADRPVRSRAVRLGGTVPGAGDHPPGVEGGILFFGYGL